MAIVFNADNRFYYSKLNTAEKRLYKFMADCLINNQYKFIYINEFDTVPVNNDLPMFVYKIDEFIIASKVWTSLIMDCPEFYYVEEYDFILDDNVALMGKENPYYTQTEIEEINKALDDIYHNFDHLNDEYEIELAVNDYIINNYQYDYETTDYYIDENDWMFDINLWRRSREKFNVVGLIKYKKGVCSAFTHLAQYIFQRKGLNVINITGELPADDMGHRWLLIKLDNEYYSLDITYNLYLANDIKMPQYMFFNSTYDVSKKYHFPLDTEVSDLLKNSKGIKYNYYHKNNLFFYDLDNLYEALKNNLDKDNTLRFDFNVDYNIINDDVKKIVKKALKKYDISKYYLSNKDNYYALTYKGDE